MIDICTRSHKYVLPTSYGVYVHGSAIVMSVHLFSPGVVCSSSPCLILLSLVVLTHRALAGCIAGISEVPDIRFTENASNVTEDDGVMTVCAVAGYLAEEITPINVTISTVPSTAEGKLHVVSKIAGTG